MVSLSTYTSHHHYHHHPSNSRTPEWTWHSWIFLPAQHDLSFVTGLWLQETKIYVWHSWCCISYTYSWVSYCSRLPITWTFQGNRRRLELAVWVTGSLKQITGNKKMGRGMNASIMHTLQNLINTQCWTLYLNWNDKKVKTKMTWLLK